MREWITFNSRVALAYFIMAQVGFLLAMQQDVPVTLFWPPSGIALAVYLYRGNAALPGIFFGAALTAVVEFYSYGLSTLLSIGLIGSTAVVFSIYVGGNLLHRVSPSAPIWGSAREFFLAFLCMALACSITAVINIGNFHLLGFFPLDGLLQRSGVYWLGELCGMLIWTAPCYLAARYYLDIEVPLTVPSSFLRPTLLYSAFTGCALVIFILLWSWESSRISGELQREASVAARNLSTVLKTTGRDLESIRALVQARRQLSEESFLRYTDINTGKQSGFLGAQAVGYAPRVVHPRRWELEKLSRGTQLLLFEVNAEGEKMAVAKRADYFPVQFIYPKDPTNMGALGFDLGSEPLRREAIERACDTGELSMAVPIALTQSQHRVPGILMAWPIYRTGAALDSIAMRRTALLGVASGVYYIDTLFDAATESADPSIFLHLADTTHTDEGVWYHTKAALGTAAEISTFPSPNVATLPQDFVGRAELHFAGKSWMILTTPGPMYISNARSWTPWVLLGLMIALGMGVCSILTERTSARLAFDEERLKTDRALLEAKSANESKSYFMAAASHDIKQPLYALGILADTLLMSDPTERMKPIVKDLQRNIKEITQHFDTLVDMGRFQQGGFEVRPTHFRLGELSRRIALEIGPLCREKGLGWNIGFVDATLFSDPELLLRIFRNLLINAVRYTDTGQIKCTARMVGDQVEFQVSDTGPGLPPEQRELLFADAGASIPIDHSKPELGMGMSIANRISRSLGVELKVSAISGRGTTFTFQLPVDNESESSLSG